MKLSRSFRCALSAAVMLGAANSVSADGYTITSVGAAYSSNLALNNVGQTAGIAWDNGSMSFGALFSGGTVTNLSGAEYGEGWGINDKGQVVGLIQDAQYKSRAFLYSNGVTQELGTLGGQQSLAYDINNAGQIVGTAQVGGEYLQYHAFLYQDGVMADLGDMGGRNSIARSVNEKGQVVGYVQGSYNRSFLYDNGVVSFMGLDDIASEAWSINDNGQIVGRAGNTAYLYSDGVLTNLGSFMGNGYSNAYGINNLGQVVGNAQVSSFQAHAFLYSGGKLLDLNDLLVPASGWVLTEAFGINDRGQIAGGGFFNGQFQGFVMTPTAVPVPAAAWLFGSGLAGLTCFARRRKAV